MLCSLGDEDGIGMQYSLGVPRNDIPFIEDSNKVSRLGKTIQRAMYNERFTRKKVCGVISKYFLDF